MVDLSVCDSPALADTSDHPSGTGVELADVVRRFGPEYRSQYGQVMMPSQNRALSDIAACCTPLLSQPGLSEMPWKTDARVAPKASGRVAAVRLFSRRGDRAVGVARRVPAPSEVHVRPAREGVGRSGQGTLCVTSGRCPAFSQSCILRTVNWAITRTSTC